MVSGEGGGRRLSDLIRERKEERGFGHSFRCGLAQMRMMHRCDPHGEQGVTLVYVLEGEGELHGGQDDARELIPGDVCVLGGRGRRVLHFHGQRLLQGVVSVPREMVSLVERVGVDTPCSEVLYLGHRAELVERMRELSGLLRDPQAQDLVVGGFFGLVSDIFGAERKRRTLLEGGLALSEACRDLVRDLPERLSIPELAGRFQMSYSAFRKEFARLMDMPPGEFRIRQRIESVKIHMRQYRSPFKDVAARFGYPDLQSFSKQFKKVTGLTPRQFLAAPAGEIA